MTESSPNAKPRRRPFLSPDFVRAMLAGHSALGLAFAALIYIVCLSGTLSVFVHELLRWEQPNAPLVEGFATPEMLQQATVNAHKQALADNAAHDVFIMGPGDVSPRLQINYHDHETGVEGAWIGDANGNLVTRVAAPWTQFVADLHMVLHLPRTWGLFLVGLTGVALLASLISGLLSHPRLFKDAFHFRWGGSHRLQEADLHNRLGVWGLPFHVVVSLSGALLGLSTLIVGVLALAAYDGDQQKAFSVILGPQPSADETAAPVPDIAAMVRQITDQQPQAVFSSMNIGHIAKAGQIVTINMRSPGHLPFGNPYAFDGSGKQLYDGGFETGSIGQQILGVLQPLHFGWFGGIFVKLGYGVLGLALTVVTHTGVTIWLARRRDRGRPSPGWERVWAAVGWSQPLAFGTTAFAALTIGGSTLVGVYLATFAAAFAVAGIARDGDATARALRLMGAIAIAAAVARHTQVWGSQISDPMAWYVSAAMLLCALTLAAPVLLGRRSVATPITGQA